jgi:hypothetical protein
MLTRYFRAGFASGYRLATSRRAVDFSAEVIIIIVLFLIVVVEFIIIIFFLLLIVFLFIEVVVVIIVVPEVEVFIVVFGDVNDVVFLVVLFFIV